MSCKIHSCVRRTQTVHVKVMTYLYLARLHPRLCQAHEQLLHQYVCYEASVGLGLLARKKHKKFTMWRHRFTSDLSFLGAEVVRHDPYQAGDGGQVVVDPVVTCGSRSGFRRIATFQFSMDFVQLTYDHTITCYYELFLALGLVCPSLGVATVLSKGLSPAASIWFSISLQERRE